MRCRTRSGASFLPRGELSMQPIPSTVWLAGQAMTVLLSIGVAIPVRSVLAGG